MLYKSHRGHITIIQKIYSCKLKHLTFGWCGDPASKGGTLAVKLFTQRIEGEKHRSNTRKVFVLHNLLPQET